MAQTYTLEEAAQRIGVPVEDFKKRIKDDWKSLRSFRDGATLRFRASDIDELARSLGEASDGGITPTVSASPKVPRSSEEFLLTPEDMTPTDSSDDDIFSIAAGDSGKSKKPNASDSNIRLDGDSGVRRKSGGSGKGKEKTGLTEEIDLDALTNAGKSGTLRSGKSVKSGESSAKLKAPKSGPNLAGPGSAAKIPGPPASTEIAGTDSSSEFELSLDADSDSFELQLNTDSPSDSIDFSTEAPARNSQSGINLDKPKDSGVSLEKTKTKHVMDDSSDDFELSLDENSSDLELSSPLSDSGAASAVGGSDTDSDSEFELSLDDNSGVTDNLAEELGNEGNQGDIFETDFSLPAVSDDAESGSEVVAVESSDTDLENSDFDLALDDSDVPVEDDESASQVVLLDDESGDETPAPRKGGRGAAAAVGAAALAGAGAAALAGRGRKKVVSDEDDLEVAEDDSDDAGSALTGVRRGRDTDDEDAPAGGYAPPAKWGALQVIPLFLCLILTFLGGLMSYELLRGMWGYHNGQSATGGIANSLAGMLGMAPEAK